MHDRSASSRRRSPKVGRHTSTLSACPVASRSATRRWSSTSDFIFLRKGRTEIYVNVIAPSSDQVELPALESGSRRRSPSQRRDRRSGILARAPVQRRILLDVAAGASGRRFRWDEDARSREESGAAPDAQQRQRQRARGLPARAGQHDHALPAAAAARALGPRRSSARILLASLLVVARGRPRGRPAARYLWFHQSVAAVRAHSTGRQASAQKQLDVQPARPGGDRARRRLRPARRRRTSPTSRARTR